MIVEFLGGPLDGERKQYPLAFWPPATIRMRREDDSGRVVMYVYRYAGGRSPGSVGFEFIGSEEGE